MRKWTVAIVVQRYGAEVNGGAEVAARWLAEQLLPTANVHVITTCALDYTTWADYYEAGESELNGVHVHRFSVDAARRWRQSQKRTGQLLQREHSLFDEVTWVKEQGPFSNALFDFIRRRAPHFDIFFFFSYHYATTYFGLPLVSEKAILVPTAHDDPYLCLPVFRPLFHLPQALVYLTEPEKRLVQQVTHNAGKANIIAGVGIDVPQRTAPQRFREKYGVDVPFLLYVGRIHESKNVPELLAYFSRFAERRPDPLKLVLIGKSHLALPDHPDIIHLGFLPEQDKFDALAAASVVIVPSLYESLSIITLESWRLGVPVLVNGRCDVLKHQCRQSNAGLYYTSYDEFAAATTLLLDSAGLLRRLGKNGQAFVKTHYDSRVVAAKYRTLLADVLTK